MFYFFAAFWVLTVTRNNVYEKKKDKLFEKEAHKNYYLRVKKIYR